MRNLLTLLVILFYMVMVSCNKKGSGVKIGYQTWASENLDVTKFRNGDEIAEVQSAEEWNQANEDGRPAWCYYNNDPETGKMYGKLYNWFAIGDEKKLAPEGWHIPTSAEWKILVDYAGGRDSAARNLKSVNDWISDGIGINKFGFNALPGGFRSYSGAFKKIKGEGIWWCDEGYKGNSKMWVIDSSNYCYENSAFKGYGYSIRCVKDK